MAGVQTDVRELVDTSRVQKHRELLEWLTPIDYSPQQHDIISRRHEDTAQWFLDSPEFKRWLQGSDKTLFCPGIPGAGKTMMAAIAIDYLCKMMIQHDNIGVAYLFCSYKTQNDQTALSLFAALLKQLVQNQLNLPDPVIRIYKDHSEKKSRPLFDEIFQVLQAICSNYTIVYIVIDALDECANGTRVQLIDKLRELQAKTDVRLLFTSRFNIKIEEKFQSDHRLEVRAGEEDVRRFLKGQMSRLPNHTEQLKRTIEDKIAEAVDGM
jgi:NACHT domain